MASEVGSAVFAAARALYATAQQVKANKRQSRLLADRVGAIVEPVHAFSDARLAQGETQHALGALLAVIQDASKFVRDFQDIGRIKRVVFKTDHAERFADLNARLGHAAQALTLGVVLQLHFSSADDVRAHTQDSVGDKEALGVWAIAPAVSAFVGREPELKILNRLLQPSASARAPATRIAICGMGGTGKSTLAQWAASRHADRFTSGWVLDGSNAASLQAGLRQVAVDLGLDMVNLDQIPRVVRVRLGRVDRAGWLLIVDNVDDATFAHDLPAMLPNTGGCILVTSRLAHWDREDWASISLTAMAPAQAVEMLQAGDGDAAVHEVVAHLGGLPLALVQARTVVRRTRIGWAAYLAKLRTHAGNVLGDALPSLQLSLEAAMQACPLSSILFQMLQALHADDVPRTILADAYRRASGVDATTDIDGVLEVLADFSIFALTEQFVSAHRLMQEAMHDIAPLQLPVLLHLGDAMNAGTSMRSTGAYDADPRTSASLALHYPVLVSKLRMMHSNSLELADAMLGHLQVCLMTRSDRWLLMAQQCLAEYEQHLSDDDVRKAPVLILACGVFSISRSRREGLALAKRFMEAAQRAYPTNEYFLAWSQSMLGFAQFFCGNYRIAFDQMQEGTRRMSRTIGDDHPTVAVAAWSWGQCSASLGDYRYQLEINERALPVHRRHYGAKSWYFQWSTVCVGDSLCELGDIARGLPMLQNAIVALDETYGDDSPLVNRVRLFLAKAFGRAGAYPRQLQACQKAYDFFLSSDEYGQSDTATSLCAIRLGDAYGAVGQAAKQRELIEDALPTLVDFFPPDHIEIARAHAGLGEACGTLGDPARQVELQERALVVFEDFFGIDHIETVRMRTHLARGYLLLGGVDRASSQLERALAAQERFFKDGEHGDVAQTLTALAAVHKARGGAQEQRACLTRALSLFERHYGADHPAVGRVLLELAPLESDPARRRSLAERAQAIGPMDPSADHRETARAIAAMAPAEWPLAPEPALTAVAPIDQRGRGLAPADLLQTPPEEEMAASDAQKRDAVPGPPSKWGPSVVSDWLAGLELNDHAAALRCFRDEGVQGRHLLLLTDAALMDFGIRGGDRLAILHARDVLFSSG